MKTKNLPVEASIGEINELSQDYLNLLFEIVTEMINCCATSKLQAARIMNLDPKSLRDYKRGVCKPKMDTYYRSYFSLRQWMNLNGIPQSEKLIELRAALVDFL